MGFFSYVLIEDLGSIAGDITLLKSAASAAELLADPSYDPDQVGSYAASLITDTGTRQDVTNTKTGNVVSATICAVS